jgi:hypothetical protein
MSKQGQESEEEENDINRTALLPPKRKVIQICSQIDSVGKYLILAVCDDGTIWQLDNLYREGGNEPEWEPFPNVPQDA